ncbi:ComEC/Rec2 family competence protein [Streptomyces peucetius]|uniref:ComEC/Rec2 family competence protein n=1 Tax=Streptomyces peucetius TaxID=1950 RepID=A0ABY6I5R3_STRPE|nr:ComEC/Rec2 family competence protein [Streptomyces peucetius]UYQ62079.1 ComEC/Rec2 family competence protein [Streptomyces peucetius]
MTRVAVHAPAGHRPDAADPHQESGPTDLRLVPPLLATWAASALALGAPGRWTAAGAAACLAAAALLPLWAAARRRRAGRDPVAAAGSHTTARAPAGRPRRWLPGATALAAALVCAAAGAVSAGLHGADLRRGPLPGLADRHARVTVELTVTSDPRPTSPKVVGDRTAPAALVLNAEATRVTAPGGPVTATRTPVLLLVSPGEEDSTWERLLPSTRLRVGGRLAPPLRSDDPFAAVLRADNGPPRTIGRPTALQRTAGDLRAGLREATDELAPDARALLPGLVVGDTTRIPADLQDAFEATDLTHLLAVSGSNLTVVLILLIGPPGTALLAERRGLAPRLGITLRGTALLGGALTLAFVLVCRPEPSVLRAAACGLITLLAIGTGRRRSLVPALAAAALLLLLYDPWLARSYGFLLSVLATGALLTIGPRWSAALQRRRVPPRLAEALAAAAAAQAVCAPVVAAFAARVSLVAIPCNLAAELAVAPATLLGFAALAAAPFAMPVAELLARCAGWPAGWIASVARAGAALPGAQIDWPGGWRGGLLLAALTAAVLLVVRRLTRHPWAAALCALLLVLAVVRPAPLTARLTGWPPPDWALVMCDVGQGDAMVLAAGDGAAVVVDAGPDPHLTDRCLSELGVTKVPLLLVTHFHADHVAGLAGALRGRAVGAIQTTTFEEPRWQAEFVRRTAAVVGVPVIHAIPGERRRAGRLSWQVLWPDLSRGTAPEGPNDASVALLVRAAGGLSMLLLGDLEPPSQRRLIRSHPALPSVDVLKVAHHGSAYQDPGLLAGARPRLALISCGRDNPYGHPAPRTVGALRAQGALVLRTDRDGAIAVTGAGTGLRAVARGAG